MFGFGGSGGRGQKTPAAGRAGPFGFGKAAEATKNKQELDGGLGSIPRAGETPKYPGFGFVARGCVRDTSFLIPLRPPTMRAVKPLTEYSPEPVPFLLKSRALCEHERNVDPPSFRGSTRVPTESGYVGWLSTWTVPWSAKPRNEPEQSGRGFGFGGPAAKPSHYVAVAESHGVCWSELFRHYSFDVSLAASFFRCIHLRLEERRFMAGVGPSSAYLSDVRSSVMWGDLLSPAVVIGNADILGFVPAHIYTKLGILDRAVSKDNNGRVDINPTLAAEEYLLYSIAQGHSACVDVMLNQWKVVPRFSVATVIPLLARAKTDAVVCLLLEYCNESVPGTDLWSPLLAATRRGNLDLVKKLLHQHGAQYNRGGGWRSLGLLLQAAVLSKSLEAVEFWLGRGAVADEVVGAVPRIEGSPQSNTDSTGDIAIPPKSDASGVNDQMSQLLHYLGLPQYAPAAKDKPLCWDTFAELRQNGVLQDSKHCYIIESCLEDRHFMTMLRAGTRNGEVPEGTKRGPPLGTTVLCHMASDYGTLQTKIIRLLVSKGADVNHPTHRPLSAVRHPGCAALLLELGAAPLWEGGSALQVALDQPQGVALRNELLEVFLQKALASKSQDDGEALAVALRNITLGMAIERGNTTLFTEVLKKTPRDEVRQHSPIFGNCCLYSVPPPEESAAPNVKAMLAAGADVEFLSSRVVPDRRQPMGETTDPQWTPLFYVGFDWQAAEALIDAGANVNATDHSGRTPLYFASADGAKFVVQTLLKAGAKTDIKDKSGKGPPRLYDSEDDLEDE